MNQQLPLAAPPQRVPLTVRDVELLDRQGAFDGYGKVELIGGKLLYVNAQYRRHMIVKSELAYRLRRALEGTGSTLFVGTEGSVALSDHDLPQPDVLITAELDGDGAVPGHSIALLVEIADSTLPFDLSRKAVTYACGSVPEYRVVDVQAGIIHQMWSPAGEAFRKRRETPVGNPVRSATLPGLMVETTGL